MTVWPRSTQSQPPPHRRIGTSECRCPPRIGSSAHIRPARSISATGALMMRDERQRFAHVRTRWPRTAMGALSIQCAPHFPRAAKDVRATATAIRAHAMSPTNCRRVDCECAQFAITQNRAPTARHMMKLANNSRTRVRRTSARRKSAARHRAADEPSQRIPRCAHSSQPSDVIIN